MDLGNLGQAQYGEQRHFPPRGGGVVVVWRRKASRRHWIPFQPRAIAPRSAREAQESKPRVLITPPPHSIVLKPRITNHPPPRPLPPCSRPLFPISGHNLQKAPRTRIGKKKEKKRKKGERTEYSNASPPSSKENSNRCENSSNSPSLHSLGLKREKMKEEKEEIKAGRALPPSSPSGRPCTRT